MPTPVTDRPGNFKSDTFSFDRSARTRRSEESRFFFSFSRRIDINKALLFQVILLSFILTTCKKSDDGSNSSKNTYTGPPLSALKIFPEKIAALQYDGIIFKVTAYDMNGDAVPGLIPEYSSSNPDLIRIDNDTIIVALGIGVDTIRASIGGLTAETILYTGEAGFDPTAEIPHVLTANYIDLSKIGRISKFRSTVGHSYTDGSEECRSMKHYFEPKATVDWQTVDIYAPASGTILRVEPDGIAGYQILLRPRDLPYLYVSIFHVNIDPGISKYTWVDAGEHLGYHASSTSSSDFALFFGAKEGGTLISFFQAITDEVFAEFQARGVSSREEAIITKEQRDADPVPCVGEEQFTVHGTIPDWLILN